MDISTDERTRHFWEEELYAVAVLYGQPMAASSSISSLGAELEAHGLSGRLLVYDNSPEASNVGYLAGWEVEYVHDADNPGVARAYNEAADRASQAGKTWLLLLDQDSTFPAGAVQAYARACASELPPSLVAPVMIGERGVCSPCYLSWGAGRQVARQLLTPGIHALAKLHLINSGLCVSIEVFERAGGYDERIGLDYSDFAFMHRLSRVTDSFFLMDLEVGQNMSGVSRDGDVALRRFERHCADARAFSLSTGKRGVGVTVACRSVLNAVRFRDPRFLSVCATAYMKADA